MQFSDDRNFIWIGPSARPGDAEITPRDGLIAPLQLSEPWRCSRHEQVTNQTRFAS